MTQPDRPELGLEVCRLSLDLGRRRIRHARQVGIAIRCAGFIELALQGRVAGRNWPEPQESLDPVHIPGEGPDDPNGSGGADEAGGSEARMADAVYRALTEQGNIRWRHWFNHVDADRKAATGRLVRAGVWEQQGRELVDLTDGRTLLDQQQVRLAFLQDNPPDDVYQACLVLLVGAAGGAYRPMPRRARKLTRSWMPPLLMTSGRAGDAIGSALLHSMQQIVRAAPVRMLSR